jgi:hypothetical protein
MLFVVIDPGEGRIATAWPVPSPNFAALVPTPNGRGRRVFAASAKTDTADRWRRCRLTATQLPSSPSASLRAVA